MVEPIKIDRKLPPHELNARRNRKRVVTRLPGVAQLKEAHLHHQHHASPNDTVYNHALNPVDDLPAVNNNQ